MNFKFNTHGNKALSAGLQAVVFELGGDWCSCNEKSIDTSNPYLFLEGLIIRCTADDENFDLDESKEIDLNDYTIPQLVSLLTPEPELFVNVYKLNKSIESSILFYDLQDAVDCRGPDIPKGRHCIGTYKLVKVEA